MPSTPIITPKKLTEVALPLDKINVAAVREKSIRHGHAHTTNWSPLGLLLTKWLASQVVWVHKASLTYERCRYEQEQ